MSYNILIVDDSKVVRSVIAKILNLAKINLGKTYEAADGEAALELLESEWIDLIFADINMPRMNGIELVDAIRERGLLESTPVVIVSTERSVTRINELQSKGISAYLSKPFAPEHIKRIVESLLGPSIDEDAGGQS
jgi:two-component system chemotaxis response regulator CheY